MASPTIKIERYKNPANVDGWAGFVEPDDQAWILYFADNGATKFYPERDRVTGAVVEPAAPDRCFIIWRHDDPSGVSGTGPVAYGWEREDGRATVRWLGEHRTETVYEGGMASVRAIHLHNGSSEILWCDERRIVLPARSLRPYATRGCILSLTRATDHSGWILGLEDHADEWAEVKAEPAESWSDDSLIGGDYLVHGELIEGFVIDGDQRLVFETTGGVLVSQQELPSGGNAIETWASDGDNRRVRRDFEWHEVVELLSMNPTHSIVTRLTPACGGDPAYHRIPIRLEVDDQDHGGRGRTNPLTCGHCGKRCGPSDDDPCIEGLPGVMNACCGHGRPEDAYIQYSADDLVSGREAFDRLRVLRDVPDPITG